MNDEDKKLLENTLKKVSKNEITKHVKALDYFAPDLTPEDAEKLVSLFKESYKEVQKKLVINIDIEFKDIPMAECVRKFLEDNVEDYWYCEHTQGSFMTYHYFDVSKLDELIDDIDNELFDLEKEFLDLVKDGAIQLANYIRFMGINRVFRYE